MTLIAVRAEFMNHDHDVVLAQKHIVWLVDFIAAALSPSSPLYQLTLQQITSAQHLAMLDVPR